MEVNTLVTMGIISKEVYNNTAGKDYFTDLPNNPDGSRNYQKVEANGTTYKVIDLLVPILHMGMYVFV